MNNTLNLNDLQRLQLQLNPSMKPLNIYQANNLLLRSPQQPTTPLFGNADLLSALAQQNMMQQLLALSAIPSTPVNMLSKLNAKSDGKGGSGRVEPFPEKLHRLLLEVEAVGRQDVISFVADDSFKIHDPVAFFKEIVPRYFRQSKLTSFKRQLKLYGFELISSGPRRGSYRHDLLSRKDPLKCRDMRRVAIKSPKSSQAKQNAADVSTIEKQLDTTESQPTTSDAEASS